MAKYVGYQNAGTVEFLLDKNKERCYIIVNKGWDRQNAKRKETINGKLFKSHNESSYKSETSQ